MLAAHLRLIVQFSLQFTKFHFPIRECLYVRHDVHDKDIICLRLLLFLFARFFKDMILGFTMEQSRVLSDEGHLLVTVPVQASFSR